MALKLIKYNNEKNNESNYNITIVDNDNNDDNKGLLVQFLSISPSFGLHIIFTSINSVSSHHQ